MNNQSFSVAIVVDATPQQVFDAVNNVRGWWSQNITGDTWHQGDEFTYKIKELHLCTMKLTEVIPGKKVVWEVLDNYFSFATDQSEWIGTKPTFEISPKGNQTELRFTHQGLFSEHQCFDICQNAWTGYINGSLRNLITTDKGQPNAAE
jgi:hypothetical protein